MKKQYITILFLLFGIVVFAQNNNKTSEEQEADIEFNDVEEEEVAEEKIYFVVSKSPQFPGGNIGLTRFIAENVEYPEEARKNNIKGKVYVQFVVSKTGKVKNPKVIRSVHPLLDQAAIDVVNKMPDWTPGENNGKKVSVRFTVPVNFMP